MRLRSTLQLRGRLGASAAITRAIGLAAVLALAVGMGSVMTLFGCAGKRPDDIGISGAKLAPCPSSPNCVSSDASDSLHDIPPLQFEMSTAEAWPRVQDAVSALPRIQIVKATDVYLHAECKSSLLGFVDDLELQLRPSEGLVAIRSASRVGYSDLGVNRRRVERLRAALINRGIIKNQ